MSEQKWTACWGNATSITDRRECVYAKDITLRYPIRIPFSGSALRLRFSNLTGTEAVTLTRVFINKESLLFGGKHDVTIAPGCEVESDPLPIAIQADETVNVSIYLGECTQMNAGTLITGPLSTGQFAHGDYALCDELPLDRTRSTNWFYFLNTIDILTSPDNFALICYGDSITAQSWPDYLALRCAKEGLRNVAIIRRAVSGSRILRQYDCIPYQAYGLKGETRFPIEMNVAGARAVIIQHGINDMIHPVGTDVNPFRPWSDMPTLQELTEGVERLYIAHARQLGLQVWAGTLLPIEGWRTYTAERDVLRQQFNEWLRTASCFDGCIDFDAAVRNPEHPTAFLPSFDSGDHLHPSEQGYDAMAHCVKSELLTPPHPSPTGEGE